jgi:AhpD family alkylhydroperoxidase
MRLEILESGHGFGTKALFVFIAAASRRPVLDIVKLLRYRPDYFGKPMGGVTHEALRGASAWSVGDRELMAAMVAQDNECEFCTNGHAAVARAAYRNAPKVAAVLRDLDTAEIDERLRATLGMLRKLTRDHTLDARDMRRVLDAGVKREQIEDALAVAFTLNIVTRLAEAFRFFVPDHEAMEASAKVLLARGYR